ncbi:tellurite resistance TerB family protein [Chitinophaga japonensis]|uniref:Tellurite resistance protein n=1 Tax=Chitinophaga japonensis TaxID=104662 RepID=A0A562T3A8_CHIJA|nr:TerB family tellurite resistance protein [Chitinophaga japonensis]TWI88065.1 tellurite resistance protein [Chitinophaga japonensis]
MPLTPELKHHFLNLYHIALSDSRVDMRELEMLYRIGESRGISRSDIDTLLLQPGQENFTPPETVLEKVDCLYDLCLIAWADGSVSPEEKEALELFCARLGFRDENIYQICTYLLDEASRNTPKENILSTVAQNL